MIKRKAMTKELEEKKKKQKRRWAIATQHETFEILLCASLHKANSPLAISFCLGFFCHCELLHKTLAQMYCLMQHLMTSNHLKWHPSTERIQFTFDQITLGGWVANRNIAQVFCILWYGSRLIIDGGDAHRANYQTRMEAYDLSIYRNDKCAQTRTWYCTLSMHLHNLEMNFDWNKHNLFLFQRFS